MIIENQKKRCKNIIAKLDGFNDDQCKIMCELDQHCKFYSTNTKTSQLRCRTHKTCDLADVTAQTAIYKKIGIGNYLYKYVILCKLD